MSTIYLILFSILLGSVCSQPIEEKGNSHGKNTTDSLEQAFRQAELTLNRYFYLMNSDIDHLVHAMLHIIMNHPHSFPFVPHRALDIALKNMRKKLGQNDVDIFTKPILLSMEEKSRQKPIHLTPEVQDKIEQALDKFFAENV